MAIRAVCPHCNEDYRLNDALAGKSIKCRSCSERFSVRQAGAPSRPGAAPARSRQRPSEELAPRRRTKKDSSNLPLVLGLSIGGGVLLLLAGILIVVFVNRGGQSEPQNPVQADVLPRGNSPFVPNSPPPAPPVFKKPAPPVQAPTRPWNVRWTPVAVPPAITPSPQLAIHTGNLSNKVVLPTYAGSKAVVANEKSRVVSVIDIETAQESKFVSERGFDEPYCVSPDFKHLVARSGSRTALRPRGAVVDVISLTNSEQKTLQLDANATSYWAAFASPKVLLAVTNSGQLQVWDVFAGQRTSTISITGVSYLSVAKHSAIDPSGQYVAYMHGESVSLYNLATGSIEGELRLPFAQDNTGVGRMCEGLGFAPDGEQLAVWTRAELFTFTMRKGEHLKSYKAPTTNSLNSDVQWLADKSGVLLGGSQLLDLGSGMIVWTSPNRMIGSASALLGSDYYGGSVDAHFRFTKLPREQFQKQLQLAKDVESSIKTPNRAEARTLSLLQKEAAWKYVPDARATFGTPRYLSLGQGYVPKVAIAESAKQVVAVNKGNAESLRAARFDLTTGKELPGMAAIPFSAAEAPDLVDVSPDGKMLAIYDWKSKHGLRVFALDDYKVIGCWSPSDHAKSTPKSTPLVRFVSAKHLLTMSLEEGLTMWSLPECKAVYKVNGRRVEVALSANRKFLAAKGDNAICILEAETGELVGLLPAPAKTELGDVHALAFRPDGMELIALATLEGMGPYLLRWELDKGTLVSHFACDSTAQTIQYCGDQHLLLDVNLVSLRLRVPLVRYNRSIYNPVPGSPDGRVWLCANTAQGNMLFAQSLPDPFAQQCQMLLDHPATQFILRPGSQISLQLNIQSEHPTAVKMRETQSLALKSRLENFGWKVLPNQPLTLEINVSEGGPAQSKTYDFSDNTQQTVLLKSAELVASLKGPTGEVLWSTKETRSATLPDLVFNIKEPLQEMADRNLWSNAATWVGAPPVPSVILQVQDKTHVLPFPWKFEPDR